MSSSPTIPCPAPDLYAANKAAAERLARPEAVRARAQRDAFYRLRAGLQASNNPTIPCHPPELV